MASTNNGFKPLSRRDSNGTSSRGAQGPLDSQKSPLVSGGSFQSAGRVRAVSGSSRGVEIPLESSADSESGAKAQFPLAAAQCGLQASRGITEPLDANSRKVHKLSSQVSTLDFRSTFRLDETIEKDKNLLVGLLAGDLENLDPGPALVEVYIGNLGRPAHLCLDTGAGACYLSERIANGLQEPYEELKIVSLHAGGEQMDIIGSIEMEFVTHGAKFKQKFIVARGLPVDGILGNTFSRKHVPLVRLDRGDAIFCNGPNKYRVPLLFSTDSRPKLNYIRTKETLTIPPKKTAYLRCIMDAEGLNANLRPVKGLAKRGLLITSTFETRPYLPREGMIRLHNMSTQCFTVYAGMKLGKFLSPASDRINLIRWMGSEKGISNLAEIEANKEEPDEHDWPVPGPDLLNEIDLSHLIEEQRSQMGELIMKFKDRFNGTLGLTHLTKHSIRLKGDAQPILMHPYRMSPIERRTESNYIEKLLDQNVLGPSNSPWGFPNVLVPKRDPTPEDSHRVTTNFSRLNQITVRDAYPLPRVSDAIDSLSGAKYFTILDANSGFFQIPMDERDQEKVTMTTHEGLFSYKRMPMGLTNSPATFQRLVDRVTAGIRWKICMAYMDDIAVYSKIFEDHLAHVAAVLKRFREAGLTLRLRKCSFAKKSLRYLGYIISEHGWEVNPSKVKAIQGMRKPENLKEVRAFLGMMGFFRMFVRDYAKIARPLTNLTRKEVKSIPKAWSNEHQRAFEILKESLTRAPILAFPNFEEPFILETDASKDQLGAILMQKSDKKIKVTGYYSRKLSRAEENYSTTEKECLAVVWAVTQCCRPYLYGNKFTVITDHEALRWLLNLKDPHGRLARWALKLMNYDFEIVTRPGRVHSVPDALSRLPQKADLVALLKTAESSQRKGPILEMPRVEDREGFEVPSREEFIQAYKEDPLCNRILEYYQKAEKELDQGKDREFQDCIIEDGIIYKLDFLPREKSVLAARVVVPRELVKNILEYYHCALPSGHMGIIKTYDRVRANYWWPGIQKDVYQYVSLCDTCLRFKQKRPPKQAYLKPIQPERRFELIAMDILKLNRTHRGHQYALVMTDMFTKFTKVSPLPDQSAITVAEAFVDDWLSTFGAPEKLLTDRGSQFTGELFLSLCRLIGVKKIFTTPYHPQTDGVVERNNRTIVKMLAMFVATDQQNWDDIISMATYAHNTAVHSTTGQTPYKMMFGVEAPDLSPEAYALQEPYKKITKGGSSEKFQLALAQAHELARRAIKKAQGFYKRQYDKSVVVADFNKGDLVYLWQPSTRKEGSRKLTAPWRGPYRIKEKVNDLNVILNIPTLDGETSARVHVNRLRKASEELMEVTPLAIGPLHENLPEGHYFIDRLVGERRVDKRSEFRVRWQGYGRKHDTWEQESNLPPIIVNEYRAMVRAKKAQRVASQ